MWFRLALAVGFPALTAGPARANTADNTVALIKRLSQEFSDASASGNASVFARYLDDRVVFVNEDGAVATLESSYASRTYTSLPRRHVERCCLNGFRAVWSR